MNDTSLTRPLSDALSGVQAPHAECVHCHGAIYRPDPDSPAIQEGPAGAWATLSSGTSCPFRDDGGHAVYAEPASGDPMHGGDVGGDGQASESWCRRFVRHLDNGLYAVITPHFYVHDERMRTANEQAATPVLMRQTEFALCRDPRNIGSTEEYCDYTYVAVDGGEPTEHAARHACTQIDSAEFTWDGTPQVHYQQIH